MIKQSSKVKPKTASPWSVADGATLEMDAMQLANHELAAAVERELEAANVLDSRHFNDFTLSAQNHTVLLRGHVLRASSKQQIEQVALRTHGVVGVDNQLVADNDLETNVAQALSAVTSEHHERLFVNARQGIIDLSGKASSVAVRDAAEQCAANVPHVRAVVSHIEAPNVPAPDQPRLVQPRVGQAVMAQDMALGRVE